MSTEPWLQRIALAVDTADRDGNLIALYGAIRRCNALSFRAPDKVALELYYYESNCWSAIARLKLSSKTQWSWHQPEYVNQVFCLRRILNSPTFNELSVTRQQQTRTNFANIMNTLGRPIAAINAWGEVIAEVPEFAAALGNRGFGLIYLAKHLPDIQDKIRIAELARHHLTLAISDEAIWDSGQKEEAHPIFVKHLKEVRNFLDGKKNKPRKSKFKSTDKNYYNWCEKEKLHIDPLNIFGIDNFEREDWMHLPPHTYNIRTNSLRYVNMYNQLKSDYAYARRNLYEGINYKGFDHTPVNLFDPFDDTIYGHSIEKFKSSLCDSYAIFDKIAVFINDYFNCEANIKRVNFRKVWYDKLDENKPIRAAFYGNNNWPLRGLFFLSKDLFDKDFNGIADPDGETLDRIRNQIEHRFLSVTADESTVLGDETLSYINLDALQKYALQMLVKAREALILLCLAMHTEEFQRKQNAAQHDKDSIVIQEPARPANKMSAP
ncbi:hypothetical protein F1654_08665 [Alkalicaulis satelles]|uniref:LA2681-like HEPN domain-containing protein n=1 Tax=Alkalicaulis satelles TaxID=2609175 RepID=A0A5M6ZHT5_9PROT|nr:LA2681 family HEPN domain-containing protein [Alkalicaulis satelles]KAA5803860.1 hypothetical protein F1654_08665 [Alkalicaulis satelles]